MLVCLASDSLENEHLAGRVGEDVRILCRHAEMGVVKGILVRNRHVSMQGTPP